MIASVDDFAGAPLLRRELTLDSGHGELSSALLHMSSLGIFEAFIDGIPVGTDVLSPGWSSYEWRLRYRTYDVTALLRETSVLFAAVIGAWRLHEAFTPRRALGTAAILAGVAALRLG